jgi:uncharacterized protein
MIKNQEKMIKLLTVLFPEGKIYLFGSRVRGDYKVTSDIDIAIDSGHRLSTSELAQAQNIIEALNIPQKVDLVDLSAVPVEVKNNILKEAIVWKN